MSLLRRRIEEREEELTVTSQISRVKKEKENHSFLYTQSYGLGEYIAWG